MRKWVIDGMNVVGSTPDGWWRDRTGAMRRLAGDLAAYAERSGDEVTVVFDGRPFDVDAGPVTVAFAPQGGRNAADDAIERLVGADPDRAQLTVVTSDRELAQRVRAHGANVAPARSFTQRLRDRG
jgi:predicted RNA-binding protein with PIN domain